MFVRLDKIQASAHIVSFAHAEELENGMIVELGKLGADKDSYLAKDVANINGRIVLHASVAFDYTETMKSEFDFRLKAGQKGRGFVLAKGDIVTVDADVITASKAIEVGHIVQPAAGKNLAVVDTQTAKIALEVIDKETILGVPCLVLEVI